MVTYLVGNVAECSSSLFSNTEVRRAISHRIVLKFDLSQPI
ncbi:hypothetical protein BAOM_2248 [Peribacillus asahii]|uniref:Uncharacterized protein n=1 Tax=Peribacillus asahii TaxID=228899 RepID=A0A3T0KR40_9BACI|nr:hypothetical protein BAOM_2248 [Peribacillus asahii]